MKWISVEDRLPEPMQDVLVFVHIVPGKIRTAYLAKVNGEFYDFGTRRNGTPVQPTHWMPLPEPPD